MAVPSCFYVGVGDLNLGLSWLHSKNFYLQSHLPSPSFCFSEARSHSVAQTGWKLWSSCLCVLSAGITGVCSDSPNPPPHKSTERMLSRRKTGTSGGGAHGWGLKGQMWAKYNTCVWKRLCSSLCLLAAMGDFKCLNCYNLESLSRKLWRDHSFQPVLVALTDAGWPSPRVGPIFWKQPGRREEEERFPSFGPRVPSCYQVDLPIRAAADPVSDSISNPRLPQLKDQQLTRNLGDTQLLGQNNDCVLSLSGDPG